MRRRVGFLRIIDSKLVDDALRRSGEFDADRVVSWKVGLGFNAEHFSALPRGEVSQEELEEFKRLLSEYLDAAERRGLRVFVYLNVHWHDVEELERHPDWFQVDYDGRVIDDVYGRGLMPCVNSPGWREYSIRLMEEVARVGPYGIFLDGPVFHPRGCYCEHCLRLYGERYGGRPPRKGDLANKEHRKLVEFQQDSLADYMREAYERVRAASPDVLIYLNGEPLRPNWSTGRDNAKLARYQDLIGAEGGFEYYDLLKSPFLKCSMTAKLLEAQAPDKPRVIFIAAKHSPWNREPLTGAELKLRCAEALANGAYYWIGYTHRSPELEGAMREVNSWLRGREEYVEGSRNAARVALYWSQLTANAYGGTVPISDFTGRTMKFTRDYFKSFVGAYELLVRCRVPFKLAVGPEQLEGAELLVMPNVACLTEEEVKAVADFVRRGGRLISSFETSLYSPEGERLRDFALAEVLGVRHLGIEEYGTYENYVQLEGGWVPCYTYVVRVELSGGRPLGYLTENSRGWYQEIRVSKYPGVVESLYGRGASVYFAGNFFQTFADFRFSSYIRYFRSLVGRLMELEVSLPGAPPCLEVTLREAKGALEVHLVNFASELMRPIHAIVPLRGLALRLPRLRSCREALSLINEGAVERWEVSDGGVSVEIKELREYEVVVIRP